MPAPVPPQAQAQAQQPQPAAAEPLPKVALASFAPEQAAETLERLSLPEGQALGVLLRRWGLGAPDLGRGDPCPRIAPLGLRCEREHGRLSHVRFFDRPVLLRLMDLSGQPRYAVLVGLDEVYGTLDLGWGSELVPIAGIESVWTGDYTVVWQLPPTGAALIGPGASGDSVRWLRRLLSEVPGSGVAYTESGRFDAMLSGAVRDFQSARGLAADGIAGPRTLIQLHNAAGVPGIPRLMPQTDEGAPRDAVASQAAP
jgi:general secretion pathway protein A